MEIYGVNSVANDVRNTFILTASMASGSKSVYYYGDKQIYVGAYRTNFTGALQQFSDVKISDVKYWRSYIDNETVNYHSYDIENYGLKTPYRSDSPKLLENLQVPQIET